MINLHYTRIPETEKYLKYDLTKYNLHNFKMTCPKLQYQMNHRTIQCIIMAGYKKQSVQTGIPVSKNDVFHAARITIQLLGYLGLTHTYYCTKQNCCHRPPYTNIHCLTTSSPIVEGAAINNTDFNVHSTNVFCFKLDMPGTGSNDAR